MAYAPVNGIQLYYEEYGTGTPLVLVHGFSSYGGEWVPILPPLVGRYRVIVPDLRGHGQSTGVAETIHHKWFADYLIALLDYLGIERAHFVGHSSGAMCLLFVGTEHQDRVHTLTLVSATYTFDEFARRHMREVATGMRTDAAFQARIQEVHGSLHGLEYGQVLADAFEAFTRAPRELPFRAEDLSVIQRPVLILHGDRDEFFPVDIPTALYRAIPAAELCILPCTGHELPDQWRDLFLQLLTGFLERHADPCPVPRDSRRTELGAGGACTGPPLHG
jgi:pimeloyl-ACP methyl ester carboxylesterase